MMKNKEERDKRKQRICGNRKRKKNERGSGSEQKNQRRGIERTERNVLCTHIRKERNRT